jgi:hypothetical protein
MISALPTWNFRVSDLFRFTQKVKNARHVPQMINMNKFQWKFKVIIEMLNEMIAISDTSKKIYFYCLYFLLSKPIALFLQWLQLFYHAVN